MKHARSAMIASMGLFALVAQTLLFRDFISALEGNELAVGAFFGSWLMWIAIGAVAAKLLTTRRPDVIKRFEFVILSYIPAFCIQHFFILNARSLAGVEAWEVIPIARMIALAFVTNSLVSFMTGFSFTLACKWCAHGTHLPAARVYILETLGAGVGGIAATIGLAAGLEGETVFGLACAGLLVPILFYREGVNNWSRPKLLAALTLAAALAACAFPCGSMWAKISGRSAWARLLPADGFQGHFTTPQGVYLYGVDHGRFTLMNCGGVSETLPETESSGESIALHLSQNPEAKKVLVVGPGGLSIAIGMRTLEQIEKVVWLHTDPTLPDKLSEILPQKWKSAMRGIETPGIDVRKFLKRGEDDFDIVILNLPEAATLALNRYSTREFFESAKTRLAPGGIISIRMAGGANYLGGELVFLGASVLTTMESVFERIVCKPGESSLLFATDSGNLSDNPETLSRRFAAVPGAQIIYPPNGLYTLFPKDRIAFQMQQYREAQSRIGLPVLTNTAKDPKVLLFNLLLALRRAGLPSLAKHLPTILKSGVWIAFALILIFGLLRPAYLLKSPRTDAVIPLPRLFDAQTMIVAMGAIAMSLNIILMFHYQSQYGSLFLYVGLISALFMIGSFVGGSLCEKFVAKENAPLRRLVILISITHLLVILMVHLTPQSAPRFVYACLFGLCGIFGGAYFPLAAKRLQISGASPESAGARLEILDHVGGAAGALATGIVCVPILGSRNALMLSAMCVAFFNIGPMLISGRRAQATARGDLFDRLVRPAGYFLFGVGAFFVIATRISGIAGQEDQRRLFTESAGVLAGGAPMEKAQTQNSSGTRDGYFIVRDAWKLPGEYIFASWDFAQAPPGYGGALKLAVSVDSLGNLKKFSFIQSRETPVYLNFLESWMQGLSGKNLFRADALRDVDAVSGATLTSKAVLRALAESGVGFATGALGKTIEVGKSENVSILPAREFFILAALLALGIVLRFYPRRNLRRVFLLIVLVATGFIYNLQYSSDHVMALLTLNFPPLASGAAFFLIVIIPVSLILFGNIYCGWLCPFGAAQELVGELRPKSWATDPHQKTWRYARFVKYLLLLLFVILFSLTGDRSVLEADPLMTVFGKLRGPGIIILSVAILVASFFYRRFWCRNLCPVGAFCSLIGSAHLLRRFMPSPKPSACDLGVQSARDLDCIHCDRCHHE